MGDPSHIPVLPQDVGTSNKTGIFPRRNTASCSSSASKTQSYCTADDKFCDSGNSVQVHIQYVALYGKDAASFVVSKVGNATAATGFKGAAPGRTEFGMGWKASWTVVGVISMLVGAHL